MTDTSPLIRELQGVFGNEGITHQETTDSIPTVSIAPDKLKNVLRYLKRDIAHPYEMLYDLTAIDERSRVHTPDPRMPRPDNDFTLVYHLMSFSRNEDIRLKVPLK